MFNFYKALAQKKLLQRDMFKVDNSSYYGTMMSGAKKGKKSSGEKRAKGGHV
jgi:hypothetical protein